eukprot:UN12038
MKRRKRKIQRRKSCNVHKVLCDWCGEKSSFPKGVLRDSPLDTRNNVPLDKIKQLCQACFQTEYKHNARSNRKDSVVQKKGPKICDFCKWESERALYGSILGGRVCKACDQK